MRYRRGTSSMPKLSVTTWNINSVRLRLPHVLRLLQAEKPDVLCLQEIKCVDDAFPALELAALGYKHQHIHGQKSYNGVAILSKKPLTDLQVYHRVGREDRRHISAVVEGIELHNVYLPAGGDIPEMSNPKFVHKLDFVDELAKWGEKLKKRPRLLVGDLNIAPLENDVWSHKKMLKIISHTPVEVEKFLNAQAAHDWVDVARHFTPDTEKLYSWWSYRSPNWQTADLGRRLDHIWATPDLKSCLKKCSTLRDARAWESPVGPSDHVPVTAHLSL